MVKKRKIIRAETVNYTPKETHFFYGFVKKTLYVMEKKNPLSFAVAFPLTR